MYSGTPRVHTVYSGTPRVHTVYSGRYPGVSHTRVSTPVLPEYIPYCSIMLRVSFSTPCGVVWTLIVSSHDPAASSPGSIFAQSPLYSLFVVVAIFSPLESPKAEQQTKKLNLFNNTEVSFVFKIVQLDISKPTKLVPGTSLQKTNFQGWISQLPCFV